MTLAIGALIGLGTVNLGLYADLRSSVHNLESSVSKIDTLQEETEDIQETIDDIIENIQILNKDNNNVRESLELFMILDQLHIKVSELDKSLEQFIQDLVLANSGQVTSTLFSLPQLLNVTHQAKYEWNFLPFFNDHNIALYYPILNSYINNTEIVIDIPFSSDLKYYIYNLIPFPMKFNGSVLTVDTQITSPVNYILSIDGLKESQIVNDDLINCKKTNVALYLCPASYFTFNEALSNSCEAALVKNISISRNCNFKTIIPSPRHETFQDSHYFYFPNQTTVSLVCPNLQPHVASIEGLYRVPIQCELHSATISTVAYKKETVNITTDSILQELSLTFSNTIRTVKIRKRYGRKSITPHKQPQNNTLWYVVCTVPVIVLLISSIFSLICIYKRFKRHTPVIRHISSP